MKKNKYIIVDLTDMSDPDITEIKFIRAKVNAGESIQPYEFYDTINVGRKIGQLDKVLDNAIEDCSRLISDILTSTSEISSKLFEAINKDLEPKPNIFKRAWNWIKSKFNK